MNPFVGWLIAYVFPWLVGTRFLARIHKPKLRAILVHVFLLLSIASGIFILQFELVEISLGTPAGVICILGAAVLSFIILRWNGILYTASVTIQEFCMLTSVIILAGRVPLELIFILIIPPFALSHVKERRDWHDKVPLTMAWGIITIVLFLWLREPLLNAALHAVLGALVIRKGIFYQAQEKTGREKLKRQRPKSSARPQISRKNAPA